MAKKIYTTENSGYLNDSPDIVVSTVVYLYRVNTGAFEVKLYKLKSESSPLKTNFFSGDVEEEPRSVLISLADMEKLKNTDKQTLDNIKLEHNIKEIKLLGVPIEGYQDTFLYDTEQLARLKEIMR